MKKIMNILFLSCLKTTELIEKKLHFKLSFKEILQLKVHKLMCSACTIYETQSIIIDKGISNLYQPSKEIFDVEELKAQIIEKVR